jgi:hypothetical protein
LARVRASVPGRGHRVWLTATVTGVARPPDLGENGTSDRSLPNSHPTHNRDPRTPSSAPQYRRTVVVHRPFEAPHNATTIRDRFSIPDAIIGRPVWAELLRTLISSGRVTER